MADEINKKVINIFCRFRSDEPSEHNEPVKRFLGYDYVKIDRDNNGKKFNEERLLRYAEKCHYIVRVMRKIAGEVVLYNYEVANDELFDILKKFENNTLDGTIIEIDKYIPDDLA